jgi:hypothetical protein
MTNSRKMPLKLPAPCQGRGRTQIAIRRLFVLSDEISTSMVMDAAYCRRPTRR